MCDSRRMRKIVEFLFAISWSVRIKSLTRHMRIRSTKALDAREKRILKWVYRKTKNENEWVALLDSGAAIEKREMTEYLNLDSWLNEGIINYVSQYLCARACEWSPNPTYWYFPTYLEKATRKKDFEKLIKEDCECWVKSKKAFKSKDKSKEADSVGLNLRNVE